jgi:hypothetical protein
MVSMSPSCSVHRSVPAAQTSIRRQARHVIAVTAAIWGLSESAGACEVRRPSALASQPRPRLFGLNQPV